MSPATSDWEDTHQGRFHDAVARFDRANAEDPNHELVEGVPQPKELAYARRMTQRLDRFVPDAAEPLKLAARSQHIRRWTVARSQFPAGRQGYREWRSTLAAFHAKTAGDILREVRYGEDTIERVQALLRKERLKADPDVQTLEDVVCLVFLEHYLADFAVQHEEGKLVDILRKTWRKMSDRGREAALELDVAPELRTLIEKAVGPASS